MGNLATSAKGLNQGEVFSKLENLARLYQNRVIEEIVRKYEVVGWQSCLSSLPLEVGDICWAENPVPIAEKKSLHDMVRVECVHNSEQSDPSIQIVDGFVIRRETVHRRMLREVQNPRVLIFCGPLNDPNSDGIATFDLMEHSKENQLLDLVRDTEPNVVFISGRVSHNVSEKLLQAGITVVAEADPSVLYAIKRVLESDDSHSVTSGDEFALGTCRQFLASHSSHDLQSETDSHNDEYARAYCILETYQKEFKTILIHHNTVEDFEKVSAIARWLVVAQCWRFLEVSFLSEYFVCLGKRAMFRDYIADIQSKIQSNPVTPSKSLFCGQLGGGSGTFWDICGPHSFDEKFCTATYCFNPDKKFLCEKAHEHCVHIYSAKDSAISDYMQTASPKDIKCSHHSCGYDASMHKRAFVANLTDVTISSVDLQSNEINSQDMFMWIEFEQDMCTRRRKICQESQQMSITHLLSLMICTGFSRPEYPYKSNILCLQKNNVIVKFTQGAVTPFSFVFPRVRVSSVSPSWILTDLSQLQTKLMALESDSPILDWDSSDDIKKLTSSVTGSILKEVETLKASFASDEMWMNPHLHLKLDTIHYLVSLLLAALSRDIKLLSDLGIERVSTNIQQEEDIGTPPMDPEIPHESLGSEVTCRVVHQEEHRFDATISTILHDLIDLISLDLNGTSKNDGNKLGSPGEFLWDGNNWRFLHGDFNCSIMSCFLSSRMYHEFLDISIGSPAMTEHLQEDSWIQIMRQESSETCQIVCGHTSFESYNAVQYHALRELCIRGGNNAFVASLRNCHPWSSTGGKSNVFFAKSSDNKYIIKQINKAEKQSLIEFTSNYFDHVASVITSNGGNSSCLAKIYGMFQVTSGNSKVRQEKRDFIVMQNVFHDISLGEAYDLKGLTRELGSSFQSENQQRVLLDGDLEDRIKHNPLLIDSKSYDRLVTSMKFDTDFLAKMNVMDYSLLIGVDTESQEITVGIVDFLRSYTLDKHIESWVKLLGGAGEKPTVISPIEYAERFCQGITAYFTRVPWN